MAELNFFSEDTNGLTVTEFRLRMLQTIVEESYSIVTVEMCNSMIAKIKSLFSDVIQCKDVSF